MPTLNEAANQMNALEGELKAYRDPNLGQNVQNEIMKAWSPLLQRSANETTNMMADFMPRFMNVPYGAGGGTSAADLSPQQKMQMMGRELGVMGGQLAGNSQLATNLGGSAQNMVNTGLQNLNFRYGTTNDAYGRAKNLWSELFAANEASKMRGGFGGGGGINMPAPQFPGAAAGGMKGMDINSVLNKYMKAGDENGLWQFINKLQQAQGGYNASIHEPLWAAWRVLKSSKGGNPAVASAPATKSPWLTAMPTF